MNDDDRKICDRIIEEMLLDIAFDGWTWAGVERAAESAGYECEHIPDLFPDGLAGVVSYFSIYADTKMMEALEQVDLETMRVRDRVSLAVMTRLKILAPHKEAVRLAMSYWMMPVRGMKAGKSLWQTADSIWIWAGDTATDYNRYTKRALLSGVLVSTTLAWLNEEGDDMVEIEKFLERRIENVMQLGRLTGKMKRA